MPDLNAYRFLLIILAALSYLTLWRYYQVDQQLALLFEQSSTAARVLITGFLIALTCVVSLVLLRLDRLIALAGVLIGRLADLGGRRFWTMLFLTAMVLRLAVDLTLDYRPVTDGYWYSATAESLARTGRLALGGEPTAFRFPGYSFVLALFYKLFGAGQFAISALGMTLTAVLLPSAYLLFRSVYNEGIARACTFLLAVHPAMVLHSALPLSETLFLTLLVLSLLLIVQVGKSPGVGLVILLFTLQALVFFADDRYRLPILPFLVAEGLLFCLNAGGRRDQSANSIRICGRPSSA